MPFAYRHVPSLLCVFLAVAMGAAEGVASQQAPAEPAGAAARLRARAPEVRVTDDRIALALERLIAASPTANEALNALSRSGLQVAIGSPSQLATLPDSAGGPAAEERRALLGTPTGRTGTDEPSVAWVVFRASGPAPIQGQPDGGTVERVWLAIEIDSVEAWIRNAYRRDSQSRIEQDLLAILAHEFVAHVGSVAATRRMQDFCDDPTPEQRREAARPLSWGEPPPLNHPSTACSLRVENRVRREINRALELRGNQALPVRRSYTLEVMHFARARLRG